MPNLYGIIFFDREENAWRYVAGITKKKCYDIIKSLNLGKDLIVEYHIVKMVDVWNSYDGLVLKGGKLCETNSIH